MTVCTKCLVDKADSEFYKRAERPKGITSRCKLCCNGESRKYQGENKEKCAQGKKRWADKNPDKVGRQESDAALK